MGEEGLSEKRRKQRRSEHRRSDDPSRKRLHLLGGALDDGPQRFISYNQNAPALLPASYSDIAVVLGHVAVHEELPMWMNGVK